MAYIVNAFQIPNELVDRLLIELSPNALKCYLVIVRKTIGWGKVFDAISASQFMKLTGIKKQDTVWNAIRELKDLELVEDVSIPGKPTLFKVITQTHPENGDIPKNGSPRSEGVGPIPKRGTTLKWGTQNSSSSKLNIKPKREEDEECEVEFIAICSQLHGLTTGEIDRAIQELVRRKRPNDPSSYETHLLAQVESGDRRTCQNVIKILSELEAVSEAPWVRDNRLKRDRGAALQLEMERCGFSNLGEAYMALKGGFA